ncbi:ABC transporter ATP-binding protein [Raineyella sp.]|uniref:Lipoprotein-releasing system ATP-binding protein LolD n=1 Tax=bioreactor metagenome TaxID=1076179 RepID=A0A644Z7U7_9ZZZZ|nr:ABC transporter ATP-binding protein [Raineyella sp.]MEA5155876.1 ABC transporter ATP-binding protein [Raineyella sp.]
MTDQVQVAPVWAAGISRRAGGTGGSGQWILRDCSLHLPRAALTAIVGPSGAGKTSLMYCLSGLDRPDEGRVLLDGTDIYELGRERRAKYLRTTVGFVFQQYNLISYLTVEENVLLPEQLAGRRVPRDQVTAILTRFGLQDKAGTAASALSGGEQQRVALCRAMLLRPSIVFADEPTGALDSVNSQLVLRILRDLTVQGTTVVMVTHDIDAAALADQVVFMRDGSITGVSGRLDSDAVLARMRQLTVPHAASKVS